MYFRLYVKENNLGDIRLVITLYHLLLLCL